MKVELAMLRVKELVGDTIAATDGPIGLVDEVYFGDPYNWVDMVPLPPFIPSVDIPSVDSEAERELQQAEQKARESHLRSSSEVIGDSMQATDGPIGHVEDLLIDDETWSVEELL